MANAEKLLERFAEHLEDGEKILAYVVGTYETRRAGTDAVRTGMFIALDSRLVFFAKRMGGYDLESFPYANISSFEQGKNMMGPNFRFFASGNTVAMKWIKPEGFETFAEVVRTRAGRKVEPALGGSGGAGSADPIEMLRRLGELRDAGVVTAEEFEAKKAQLLSRI